MKLADNLDRHKILDVFKFWQDQTLWSYFSLSAKKPHIQLCPNCSLYNFYPNFMKLADKQGRYKIFSELDWATLHYLLSSYMPLIAGMLGFR